MSRSQCLVTRSAVTAFALAAACGVTEAADVPARLAATPVLPVEDAYPHVSRDGNIVFQSNRIGGSKLFIVKLDGTGLRQLTTGPGEDVTPVWSPDGASIIFASDRGGNEDVWIVKADGTEARNLTNNPASDSHPQWSPDARQVVFCSTRGDGENDDIYIINSDGSGLRRLTDNGLNWDTFPSFSPDAWSPDGRRIAFSSNRSDPYQIYVMNADGSSPTRVVESPFTDVRPQWLPDGSGLIFNRERDGRIEMWQVRIP